LWTTNFGHQEFSHFPFLADLHQSGHFDAYFPTTVLEKKNQSCIVKLVDERDPLSITSSIYSNISARSLLSQSSETDHSASSSPIKKRNRRARIYYNTRKNQIKKF